MRAWVTGTLEAWPSGSESAAAAELDMLPFALVDRDTGQRFLLTVAPDSGDLDLDPARAGGLTVWGIVETISGVQELMLHVEGVERAP